MVWHFIGVYIINRTLHDRLEIRNFSSRVEKYFQHEKRNFVSPRGHVISSIYRICYRQIHKSFHIWSRHCRELRTETMCIHVVIHLKVNFQIWVLLVPVYVEILKSSDFLKNKMLRTPESRNLMPIFHICLLKSRN